MSVSVDSSHIQREGERKARPLVVLTGSSRGIGRATALELGRFNTRLALLGRMSEAQSAVLNVLEAAGIEHRFYSVDLEDSSQIERAARALLDEDGTPDAVVNNAAMIQRASIVETDLASWERQLAVNLRAPFALVRSLLPAMLSVGRGRFVQIGSIAATVGTARAAAYCASKWGLVGFTKSLAEELTDTGLSAVTILPGSVDTDMLHGSGFVPRMTANDVAATVAHYALFAPIAHNGATVEMFGV